MFACRAVVRSAGAVASRRTYSAAALDWERTAQAIASEIKSLPAENREEQLRARIAERVNGIAPSWATINQLTASLGVAAPVAQQGPTFMTRLADSIARYNAIDAEKRGSAELTVADAEALFKEAQASRASSVDRLVAKFKADWGTELGANPEEYLSLLRPAVAAPVKHNSVASVHAVHAALAEGHSLLVDMRLRKSKYFIPDSVEIPFTRILDDANLQKLPKDKTIYLMDMSGVDSHRIAVKLAPLGYRVTVVEGGFDAWIMAPLHIKSKDSKDADSGSDALYEDIYTMNDEQFDGPLGFHPVYPGHDGH